MLIRRVCFLPGPQRLCFFCLLSSLLFFCSQLMAPNTRRTTVTEKTVWRQTSQTTIAPLLSLLLKHRKKELLINCTCCSTGASIYFACWLRRIYSQISCLAMNKFIVIIYTWCGGTVYGNPKRGRSSEASFHWVMILFMLSKVKLYSAFSVYSRNGRKHRPGAQ